MSEIVPIEQLVFFGFFDKYALFIQVKKAEDRTPVREAAEKALFGELKHLREEVLRLKLLLLHHGVVA